MITTFKITLIGLLFLILLPMGAHAGPTVMAPGEAPKPGDTWNDPLTDMPFAWVPGGCFQMGCAQWTASCDEDEFPAHEVCVTGFWMGRFEVTQGQWEAVMLDNPSRVQPGPDYPVEKVSWNDIQRFITDLRASNDNRYGFRLPTEAEWEFACRSGGRSEPFSGAFRGKKSGWFWSVDETNKISYKVGKKPPNGLGLFDMSGNVWEWVADVYDGQAYEKHQKQDPVLRDGGSCRVARGGSFHSFAKRGRCGNRRAYAAVTKNRYVGFRMARDRLAAKLPRYTPPFNPAEAKPPAR